MLLISLITRAYIRHVINIFIRINRPVEYIKFNIIITKSGDSFVEEAVNSSKEKEK